MGKHDYRIRKSFTEIFTELKNTLADSNLSIKEFANNSEVDEELVAIFFDDSNNVINSISRMFEFANINLYYKKNNLRRYRLLKTNKPIGLIKREIKPYCSVNFNFATKELTNFRSKEPVSDVDKQLIINEMYEFATTDEK